MRRLLLLWALGAGCATTPSLDRSRSLGDRARGTSIRDVPARGFSVLVRARARDVKGELLAVDPDKLWILEDPDEQPQLVTVPRRDVQRVSVEAFPSGAILPATWTAIGTASTVSHGFFLIFSAPIWLGTGIPVSVDQAMSNDLDVNRRELGGLFQFARFPQGMPPGWAIDPRRGRGAR